MINSRVSSTKPILWIHAGFVALLLLGSACGAPSNLPDSTLIYGLCVALLVLFVWCSWGWWKLSNSLLDPFYMLLVSAFLFNAGQALMEVFNSNENLILGNILPDVVLARTLFAVLLGLASFFLGAVLEASRRIPTGGGTGYTVNLADTMPLRIVGWALLLVSVPASVYILRDAIQLATAGGYMALYQRDLMVGPGAGPNVLASLLIPGALFLMAGSRDKRLGLGVSIGVIAASSLIQFYLGYRSTAAMPIAAAAWLWDRVISPIRTRTIVFATVIMLLVVFPLVREVRPWAGAQRLRLPEVVSAYASIDNPALKILSEMGGSMATVAHTLTLVPEVRPFDMGEGYRNALVTLLPNFLWKIHPTIAHGTAGDWLVQVVDPGAAAQQGGLGFSFIAEAYLNFGWPGIVIMMLLFGYTFAGLSRWAESCLSPARLALVATWTAFCLRLPRDEMSSMVRPFVWFSLLPYLAVAFLAYSRQRCVYSPPEPGPAGEIRSAWLARQS